MAETWAERIEWVVERFGDKNQSAVARKMEVSSQAVNNYVRGVSVPSGDSLEALLRKYPAVNPAWLLTGEGPRERDPEEGYGAVVVARDLLEVIERVARDLRARYVATPSVAGSQGLQQTDAEVAEQASRLLDEPGPAAGAG